MTSILCTANAADATLLGMGIVAAIFIILGLFILAILLGGVFMLIGAKAAKVENAAFGKAVIASLFAGLGGSFIGSIALIIPLIGPFLALPVNIFIQVYIIKAVFDTETGKAFLTWLFNLIAQVLVAIIAVIIFWGGIAAAFAANMPHPD